MALLKCPECNNNVSDKAEACPHCGYPIQQICKKYTVINGVKFDVTDITKKILDAKTIEDLEPIQKYIRSNFNISPIKFIKPVRELQDAPKAINCDILSNKNIHQNTPKCPTCQSTNIKKISATSKAKNAVLFGLIGNKRNKQFHCNSCGYEW